MGVGCGGVNFVQMAKIFAVGLVLGAFCDYVSVTCLLVCGFSCV